jgi:SAM-dependent methyltransferase
MSERIRVTRIAAAGPVPYPTYDDERVAVHIDPLPARPRTAPPGASVVVTVHERVGDVDGNGNLAACLAVTDSAEGEGDRHFCGGTLYDPPLFVGGWSSWPHRRAWRGRQPRPQPAWHLPALRHAEMNRAEWDDMADDYQAKHAGDLAPARRWSWTPFVSTMSARPLLGAVEGAVVLELGCGGGQLGGDLVAAGARVAGLDLSLSQLGHAARLLRAVNADAEAVPVRDGSVDIVFSSFGAIGGFTEVRRTLREVARVLRPGGRAVWSWSAPIFNTLGDDFGNITPERSYFARAPWSAGEAEYSLTYGDWVEAIAGAGLRIDALHEPEPDFDAWVESSWPWWSRERTAMLPTAVIWEVSRPVSQAP